MSEYQCVCKRDKFIRDHVFDNNKVYNHLFKVQTVFKSRDIDQKSPIFTPSCLLRDGEVVLREVTASFM